MPIKWTAENDQRLLYLIINNVNVKGVDLLKAWKEKYGNAGSGFSDPTARAIEDHIWRLKTGRTGTAGTGAAVAGSSAQSSPAGKGSMKATPSKPAVSKPRTPRTPASGTKRKRGDDSEAEMSDRDDSEADVSNEAMAGLARRKSTPRRSKTPNLSYRELADASDAEDEVSDSATAGDAKAGGRGGMGEHTLKEILAEREKRKEFKKAMREGEDEVSDFDPRNPFN